MKTQAHQWRHYPAVLVCFVSMAAAAADASSIDSVCPECVRVVPFQPSLEDLGVTSRVHDTSELGAEFSFYQRDQSTILVNGIPFSNYWQLESRTKYIFHPMGFGRFIFNSVSEQSSRHQIPSLIEQTGVLLPNGGLAVYYPNHYPVSRMVGPDLVYSTISQSELLAGVLRYYLYEQTEEAKEILQIVKAALFFPYESGGIDIGVAQLELPLYRNNPEIILNGWLHTLLHLADYAELRMDEEVAKYVHDNMVFFIQNHDAWYDEERNISRYSDTSPHRVLIDRTAAHQEFRVVHTARSNALPNLFVAPVVDLDGKYSSYDARIRRVKIGRNQIEMNVTCSSLYHTRILSDSPFVLSIRSGGYDPRRATPDGSGEWHRLTSSPRDVGHAVSLALEDDELFCGYPTNFAKANSKNYYHVQHVVALLYLASFPPYEDVELDRKITEIALSWYDRMVDFPLPNYSFEDPAKVLAGLNGGKVLTQAQDFAVLLEEARERVRH